MLKVSIGLTPILEDFEDLQQLSSTKKMTKDDSVLNLQTSRQAHPDLHLHSGTPVQNPTRRDASSKPTVSPGGTAGKT